jgi:hypothetical protein|nr:MAG TPA: hypothetical protein [Caudoviricetes sp.]
MLSFKPKFNYFIQDIIISDVTLEKIRVGSIKVPGLNHKQFMGMSLSSIGNTVADHYGELMKTYSQDEPSWMSVIYDTDAIPYVSMDNAWRAAGWHDYVLTAGEIASDSRIGQAEMIGKTNLGKTNVYLVTEFSSIDAPMVARAINHACNVIPGFEPIAQGYRVSMASTLVDALETLNERHYVGVALRDPSDEDRRMMKAARVRFFDTTDIHGESVVIIGYNTIPNPFIKHDLQAVAKYF